MCVCIICVRVRARKRIYVYIHTNIHAKIRKYKTNIQVQGSMEERDAHVSRIFAGLKTEKNTSYLVQLPEGFGKGEVKKKKGHLPNQLAL